jgi:D-amino peptidase
MKVFISVDLEGVAGYVQWDVADRQREREFVTLDLNAAIDGAFEGGASQVYVTEAHANMRNIIPEEIDGRALFISGRPKAQNHMAGIDGSFDAAIQVGYHSKAGTLNGVMAHSFRGSIFSLKFNDVEVGEIGADAAIAGYYGVPVVLVTGDLAAVTEAKGLLGDIETVSVKKGISRHAALCIPPEEARKQIRTGALRALKKVEDIEPFTFSPPINTEVTYIDPSHADAVSHLPFIKRVNGCTVSFQTNDYLDSFEIFDALYRLAASYH